MWLSQSRGAARQYGACCSVPSSAGCGKPKDLELTPRTKSAVRIKISRIELGRVGFKTRDVEDLLTFYGVEDEAVRDSFLKLAREANEPGWWQQYGDSCRAGSSPTWAWRKPPPTAGL